MQWPSPNDSPYAQTPPDTALPFRLAITPYRKCLPLPMTSHYRISRTFTGQTESPSRQCMGRRKSALLDSTFTCELGIPFGVSSLASQRLPHPSQSALAGQCLRFSAKRNGGARVVSAGVDDNAVGRQGRGCRTCSGRHPPTAHTRKRYRTPHLHSVWPPHHIENACPCR